MEPPDGSPGMTNLVLEFHFGFPNRVQYIPAGRDLLAGVWDMVFEAAGDEVLR
jgi:hypothetical protein